MATRKTTTKAKTKTTKAKTTRASAAKTTKTKSTSAKAATKKTVKATAKPAVVTKTQKTPVAALDNLKNINLATAFAFAVLAILAVTMMNSTGFNITHAFLAKDPLLTQTSNATAFAPGVQSVLSVQLKWLAAATLGLSVLLPLLYATKLRPWYERALSSRVVPTRWLDLGLTSAIMIMTVALLSGVTDLATLKILGGLMITTSALGWIAEKRNVQAGRPVWSEYALSVYTGALPWIMVAFYAVSTFVYGLVRYPWYVYALYAAVLGGFILLAVNQFNQHRRFRNWANYLTVERNYLLINFVSKAAFAAILILGFQQ